MYVCMYVVVRVAAHTYVGAFFFQIYSTHQPTSFSYKHIAFSVLSYRQLRYQIESVDRVMPCPAIHQIRSCANDIGS